MSGCVLQIQPSNGKLAGVVNGVPWTMTATCITDSSWHHLAIFWSKSSGAVTVYLDSNSVQSFSALSTATIPSSSGCLAVGQMPSGSCVLSGSTYSFTAFDNTLAWVDHIAHVRLLQLRLCFVCVVTVGITICRCAAESYDRLVCTIAVRLVCWIGQRCYRAQ